MSTADLASAIGLVLLLLAPVIALVRWELRERRRIRSYRARLARRKARVNEDVDYASLRLVAHWSLEQPVYSRDTVV